MKSSKAIALTGLLGACLSASTVAHAGPLAVYGATIDKTSVACQNWGDLVSCSAPFLNYLNNLSPSTTVANGGYVLHTPQGSLDPYIVVTAGGGAQGNGDIAPSPVAAEDGFKSNDTKSDNFLATGKANGSTVGAGNLSDPSNNSLTAGDNPGTWDVGAKWLLDALTINGKRHELTIGFDFNQPQNATTTMDFWGLITLRDLDGGKPDINYEISSSHAGYLAFASGKTFAGMPFSTDFGTVQGATCIHAVNGIIVSTITIAGGQCPAGYETKIDNAQSTSDTEIINFIPELNAGLEHFVKDDGYDVLSTRLLFGCFGGRASGSFKPGLGYLADEANGGQTTHCESGGFSDVFLMAGAEMGQVPEPGTLILFGLALAALGWSTHRRSDS